MIEIIDLLKPKNGGSFKLLEAIDIDVEGYSSLADCVAHMATTAMIEAINAVLSGKQDKLTTTQLTAINSGITSELVIQIGTNTTAITGKADATALTTATANLQAQIDALVTPVTQDAEVQNARVDEEGTSYTTLKARLDAHDATTEAKIGTAESNLNAFSAKFGFDIVANVKYNSKNCPKTDGTFFTDVYTPQTWFGSGYVKIPEGATSVKYCGAGYNGGSPLTPLAFYDSSKTFISCVPLNSTAGQAVYEGSIAVPNNAAYIYQTKFYSSGSSSNSNNYTKFYFGMQYNLDVMQNAANTVGLDEITYTDSASDNAYTETDLYLVDGTTQSFGGGWLSTDFIDVSGRTTVNYVSRSFTNGSSIDLAYVAFFNESKIMISCLKSSDTTNGRQEGTIAVPVGAKYVRSVTDSVIEDPMVQLPAIGLTKKIDKIVEEVGEGKEVYTSSAFVSAAVYLVDGTSREFGDGWASTDFIDCSERTSIYYDARSFYNNSTIDVAYVAFFNAAKTMVSCLKSSDVTNGEQKGTLPIPDNAKYVRIVTDGNIAAQLIINATGMNKKVDDMYVSYSAEKYITANIICIGDSLTQGVNGDETLGEVTLIKENYPAYLSQALSNNNVKNYGRYGATPQSWYNTYKSNFDTPTSTDDVALIMLGTNGGVSDTLATDVEPYDDYNDFANTSCGCYCKIIEWLKDVTSNHIQIMLVTPPTCNVDDRPEKYNVVKESLPAIKHIAERYSIPVIDVFNESGIGILDNATFRPYDGLHFNAKGYHRIGTFIASKLKSLISTFELTDTDTEYLP